MQSTRMGLSLRYGRMLEILGVVHSKGQRRLNDWKQWAKAVGADHISILDTGIDPTDPSPLDNSADIQWNFVSNEHFEFGAYSKLAKYARSEGPYVVVNDTLHSAHHARWWAYMVSNSLKKWMPRSFEVLVDAMDAPKEQPIEIPHQYASSWIFVIRTRTDLNHFCFLVEQVLALDERKVSSNYERFIQRWLGSKLPLVGWHGPQTKAQIERKRRSIYWEHQLSHKLNDANALRSFGSYNRFYPILRIVDRIIRRKHALVS